MSMQNHQNRILSVDGLRGLCAIYILAYHHFIVEPVSIAWIQAAMEVMSGWVVQVFFCASGFLVYSSFERRAGEGRFSIREFYIRRFFRIVPLWWLVLFLVYIFEGISSDVLKVNLLFLFGFLSFDPVYLPIPPAWSLFVEELFYLAFPLLFVRGRKNSAIFYLLGFYFVSVIWMNFAATWGVPTGNRFIWRSPLNHFHFFFLGIAIQQIYSRPSVISIVTRRIGRTALTWFDVFALLGIAGLFRLMVMSELSVGLFFLAAITPLTLVHRLLSHSFLRWAGVRCYCIYIFHLFVMARMEPLTKFLIQSLHLQTALPETKFLIVFPIHVAAVSLLAGVTFVAIEKPCMRLVDRIAG
jgi:peptidoglycan/LPS O-acetylase OafA/YrhL